MVIMENTPFHSIAEILDVYRLMMNDKMMKVNFLLKTVCDKNEDHLFYTNVIFN